MRLSHQVWSHGGSTFKKNMTLNGHFSRPAETDPYTALDRLTGPLLGSHRRCQDDALSPVLIKINSQLHLPPGRWQVAEWIVRDAAFGQGEVGYRPSQLVSYFVYKSKRNGRAACQGKAAQ